MFKLFSFIVYFLFYFNVTLDSDFSALSVNCKWNSSNNIDILSLCFADLAPSAEPIDHEYEASHNFKAPDPNFNTKNNFYNDDQVSSSKIDDKSFEELDLHELANNLLRRENKAKFIESDIELKHEALIYLHDNILNYIRSESDPKKTDDGDEYDKLVLFYESISPEIAADILGDLKVDVITLLLQHMNIDRSISILQQFDPEVLKVISEEYYRQSQFIND